jgi:hypothetical protein
MAAGEPWIKVEKSLRDDPRIMRMVAGLMDREKAAGLPERSFNNLCATCVGAVIILWITADTHVDEKDVLAIGPAQIDQITGIQGFCELVPDEWLVVLDAHRVKLPGYQRHNGILAKKRAVDQRRQRLYRHAKSVTTP